MAEGWWVVGDHVLAVQSADVVPSALTNRITPHQKANTLTNQIITAQP